MIGVGLEPGRDEDNEIADAIRDSAGQTVGRAGEQIVQRQLNIPPTLTIRPGTPVQVIVTRDLVLEPVRERP